MKLIFKSLIDNTASIDGGRKKGKWWVAIILAFVSLVLALIPTFVNNISVKGSQFLSGNAQGIDYAVQTFTEEAETNGYKIIVKDSGSKENKKVAVENFTSFTYTKDGANVAVFKYEANPSPDTIVELNEAKYSVIVFSEDAIHVRFVTTTNKEVIRTGTWAGAYNKFDNDTDLVKYFGTTYPQTRDNLLSFMDKAYNKTRIASAWIQTGVMALVDLGVILLMGFMLWILTRGKTNPFRMYTILDTWKITCWLSLAPAILTIPLAFLIKNLPDIWFPMFLGIRAMWVSMKQLRPDGTGYQEPKEVKTVNVK